jgi:hypothetical protein
MSQYVFFLPILCYFRLYAVNMCCYVVAVGKRLFYTLQIPLPPLSFTSLSSDSELGSNTACCCSCNRVSSHGLQGRLDWMDGTFGLLVDAMVSCGCYGEFTDMPSSHGHAACLPWVAPWASGHFSFAPRDGWNDVVTWR